MKKRRNLDKIRFFREIAKSPPQYVEDTGYTLIHDQWMRDQIEINGYRPDCPAIDFKEFCKMLQSPGDYWPFTCTCGFPEDACIHYPVRCRHKDDLIILVIREPLRRIPPCDSCNKKKSDCPGWYEEESCPEPHFHYQAFRFRKEEIQHGLYSLGVICTAL